MRNIAKRISNFPIEYLADIEAVYDRCKSIRNISMWFEKLNKLSIAVEKGHGRYRQVENIIFELKVIDYINNMNANCVITYEPQGKNKLGKNCDLLVESNKSYLIELKSFHPQHKSVTIPYDHITENNELIMDGYCYHDIESVRGHLIDSVFDTEGKIDNYDTNGYITVLGVLLGFYLHLEDLRDFVNIYRKGVFRPDDPLGKMTIYNIKKIFVGNINEFWGFPFNQIDFNIMNGEKVVSVSLSKDEDGDIIS